MSDRKIPRRTVTGELPAPAVLCRISPRESIAQYNASGWKNFPAPAQTTFPASPDNQDRAGKTRKYIPSCEPTEGGSGSHQESPLTIQPPLSNGLPPTLCPPDGKAARFANTNRSISLPTRQRSRAKGIQK